MQRLLLIASMAGLMFTATGCLHRNVRKGHCHQCQQTDCGKQPGLLNRLHGALHGGHQEKVVFGCQPGPLGWQQGGLNYPTHINSHSWRPGAGQAGHPGHAQEAVAPGPPGGTVGYPYYTTRGPRDFLLDNPPSIGR